MAAKIPPSSRWVETYDDKPDDWLKARITHLENQERQTKGSVSRRKDLFELRKLLKSRQDAKVAEGGQNGAVILQPVLLPSPTPKEVDIIPPTGR